MGLLSFYLLNSDILNSKWQSITLLLSFVKYLNWAASENFRSACYLKEQRKRKERIISYLLYFSPINWWVFIAFVSLISLLMGSKFLFHLLYCKIHDLYRADYREASEAHSSLKADRMSCQLVFSFWNIKMSVSIKRFFFENTYLDDNVKCLWNTI